MFKRLARAKLDDEQIGQFRSRGFAVLRRAFDAEAVAKFDEWARELLDLPEVSGRHWVYRDPSLRDAVERLITTPPRPFWKIVGHPGPSRLAAAT